MLDYIFLLRRLIKYINHPFSAATATDAWSKLAVIACSRQRIPVLCDDGYQQITSRSIGAFPSKRAWPDNKTRPDISITCSSVPN
jgi:hypothetical protein